MNHIPSFLMKMNGFNFGIKNLFVMLGLWLLEFFNFLTIISFSMSLILILFDDFIWGECKNFFIQIGKGSNYLFKILMFSCFLYGFFFIANDLFVVPYSNIFLKKKGLEIYKNQIFYSIMPKHILNVPELKLNISIVNRVKNELEGCLIHLEKYNIFGVIEKVNFEQNELLKLKLWNMKGKIITEYDTLMLDIKSGNIEVNQDVIVISNKVPFSNLKHWIEILDRIKFLWISLLVAFLAMIIVFSRGIFIKFSMLITYIILLSDTVGMIFLNFWIFYMLSMVIVLYSIKVMKCLDF